MCVRIIASQRWDVFLRHGVVTKFIGTQMTQSINVFMWQYSTLSNVMKEIAEMQLCVKNSVLIKYLSGPLLLEWR